MNRPTEGLPNAEGKGDLTRDSEHPPSGAGVLGGRTTMREDHQGGRTTREGGPLAT